MLEQGYYRHWKKHALSPSSSTIPIADFETMTEIEEMEALKRAYAEMILNTTKEAAARVMEAEFRARLMEQEMNSAKEEAAGLLLRLKQMIDAKTKEAEITSFNQGQKCDELESQLNEAEGIIIDLRAELDQAEEQLYEMKNKRMLTQNGENSQEKSVKPKGPFGSESDVYSGDDDKPVWDQINEPERFRNESANGTVNPCENLTCTETANAAASNFALEGNDIKTEGVSVVRRSVRKRKLKFWDDVIAACGNQGSRQPKKPRKALPCLPCFSSSKANREKDGMKIGSPDASKELVDTEDVPENVGLVDVLVKSDDQLVRSSRTGCKYIFSRKWKRKKKSMVYNKKWKKTKSLIYPEKSS